MVGIPISTALNHCCWDSVSRQWPGSSKVGVLHHVQGYPMGLSLTCAIAAGSITHPLLATSPSVLNPHILLPSKILELECIFQDLPLGKTKGRHTHMRYMGMQGWYSEILQVINFFQTDLWLPEAWMIICRDFQSILVFFSLDLSYGQH